MKRVRCCLVTPDIRCKWESFDSIHELIDFLRWFEPEFLSRYYSLTLYPDNFCYLTYTTNSLFSYSVFVNAVVRFLGVSVNE